MSEDAGLSANPMFGVMIGQHIATERSAEVAREIADSNSRMLGRANEQTMDFAIVAATLRNEINELDSYDAGFSISIAGVRGVTRELLAELRKADPSNPLLEKKVRDKIFDAAKSAQLNRQDKMNWKERGENSSKFRDLAYGAEGSNKGGPEKSQITSNKQVVAEAGVPEHVTDRERFMTLIKELHSTLAAKDPNAPILKSQTMIDVFSEYALNEMERQPAAGNKSGVNTLVNKIVN